MEKDVIAYFVSILTDAGVERKQILELARTMKSELEIESEDQVEEEVLKYLDFM